LEDLQLELCSSLKGTNLKRVTEGCSKLTTLKLDYWKKEHIDYSCFELLESSTSSKNKIFNNSSQKLDNNITEINLKLLSLCYWDGINIEHLEIILRKFPNLTHLNLSGCYKLTNQATISIGNVLGPKLTKTNPKINNDFKDQKK